MSTNDFKQFATGAGANVTPQADWELLPALSGGFKAGKASSAQVNKAIRQSSSIAAAVGQFIADATGLDVKDDGDVAGLSSKLKDAVGKSAVGRLIGVRVITTSGTYTPTAGTKSIIVEVQGAGGGGGGVGPTNASSIAIASGGTGGAYSRSYITNVKSSYAVTVGAGGAAGVAGVNGGNGGSSTFDSITCGGGFGGGTGNGAPPILQNAPGIPTATGGNIVNMSGQPALIAMGFSLQTQISGGGGGSPLGAGGGQHGSSAAGFPGSGFGSGGGGANAYNNSSISLNGAPGANGVVVILEYA